MHTNIKYQSLIKKNPIDLILYEALILHYERFLVMHWAKVSFICRITVFLFLKLSDSN